MGRVGAVYFVFLAAIVLTLLHTPQPLKKSPEKSPMRITIAPPQVEPPPPMPEMPKLPDVTPDVAMPVVPQFTPRATPKPTPSPKAAPAAEPQQTTEAATAPATVRPVAAPAPQPAVANDDNLYSAQVRAYLESIKHYPTSKEARLQRPHGVVNVWVVLDRSGGMKEAGIEDSSGSLILDGSALSTVRGASYPPFPSAAFPGQGTHRFTVQLNYQAS